MNARARTLSVDEYAAAEKAFAMVFQSQDPRDAPLTSAMERRALWYPVSLGLDLDPAHVQAVVAAAQAVHDDAFFVWAPVTNPAAQDDPKYRWVVPTSAPETYSEIRFALDVQNAHYSPKGRWGILFSYEDHAVVGGPAEFVETLFRSLKLTDDESVRAFLDRWKDDRRSLGVSLDWIAPFLTHLYGRSRAQHWLKESGVS